MRRVIGVDVARGLAILGMFVAHLGSDVDARLPNGSSWFEVFNGRSAATFALLAGVSAGFLSGGREPVAGGAMRAARIRILVRAAILLPLGITLSLLGTPIAVILPSYAVMFAMLTMALRWRPRTLLVVAVVVLAVAPPIVFVARDAVALSGPSLVGYPLELLTGEFYPALVWIAYLLAGLALARLDLADPGMPHRLLAWGLPTAILGYGLGAVAIRTVETDRTLVRALLDPSPHSDSAVEVVGNIGVVLCVLALCLWAARATRLVTPVAATGALALTTYSVQVVAIAMIGPIVFREPSNVRLLIFILVTLVATTAWRSLVGRGPLEWVLHASSTAAAAAWAPGPPAPPPADWRSDPPAPSTPPSAGST